MSAQLSLLDVDATAGAVRKSDPISSVIGSKAANVEGERARLYAALRERPDGMLASELAALNILPGVECGQIRSRLNCMRTSVKHPVESFGTRVNAKGHPEQVWYVKLQPGTVDVIDRQGRV